MTIDYSFARYLAAKKTIDDRALNEYVWQRLAARWRQQTHAQHAAEPILELGAGIGTMVERMLERNLLQQANYDAIDTQTQNLSTARQRLRTWAAAHQGVAVSVNDGLRLWSDHGSRCVNLRLHACDALEFLSRPSSMGGYRLVIAHAFLDLVNVPPILPLIGRSLRPGGMLYATINFDGATIFEPTIDAALDQEIERLYHQTMDERIVNGEVSGDSRTGRRLIPHLQQAGFEVLAAGASDWIVHGRQGRYPDDEAYFLHFIIHTIHGALRDHPALDPAHLDAWIERRHRQIEAGELVYIAHQVDVLAERSQSPRPAHGEAHAA